MSKTLDEKKAEYIKSLQTANEEGVKMLGAGITKAFYLGIMMMFSDGFKINPANILCGNFPDERQKKLYTSLILALSENVSFIYELPIEDVRAVINETINEQLEGFKAQLESL